jgi:hypothetical protein
VGPCRCIRGDTAIHSTRQQYRDINIQMTLDSPEQSEEQLAATLRALKDEGAKPQGNNKLWIRVDLCSRVIWSKSRNAGDTVVDRVCQRALAQLKQTKEEEKRALDEAMSNLPAKVTDLILRLFHDNKRINCLLL